MTTNKRSKPASDKKQVGIAEYAVVTDDTRLLTSGVGSCLGIVLHDDYNGVSGLIHVMLPAAEESREENPAKFVDSGIPLLVEEMEAVGASQRRMRAWVVGGSEMLEFASGGDSIGSRNIAAAKQTLAEHNLSVADTDVGGNHGRSVSFDPATKTVTIRTADDTTVTI